MEIPINLLLALRWSDINSGSAIPIVNEEDRKEVYIDEFCWDDVGLSPRYIAYDERILKLLYLN